jgi:hypothetical protein
MHNAGAGHVRAVILAPEIWERWNSRASTQNDARPSVELLPDRSRFRRPQPTDKCRGRLLPEELLTLGFAFYESTRATDALPADDASFGDALLFRWGTREALVGHYGECYYFDLTRQFIS